MVRPLAVLVSAFALAALTPACASDDQGDEPVAQDGAELADPACEGKRSDLWLWGYGKSFDSVLSSITMKPCMHVYANVPLLVADKTTFHKNVKDEIAAIHKYGPNFHAVAEFHVGTWRQWVTAGNGSWADAGRLFRQRMDDAGFDVKNGTDSDTWFVQELGSTLAAGNDQISAATVRGNAREMIGALYEGGKAKKMGAVTRANVGQMAFGNDYAYSAHKRNLEDLLTDEPFWNAMNSHVRWWLEEVFADPHATCDGSLNIGQRARHVNSYTMHLPRLASAEGAPASAGAARSFFSRRFVPLMNAAYDRPKENGYGDNEVSIDAFEKFVSLEVYAARSWANEHSVPEGRMGFAWAPLPTSSDDDVKRIGTRIGHAFSDSHGKLAQFACSPSGAYTFCPCDVGGAKADDSWENIYAKW